MTACIIVGSAFAYPNDGATTVRWYKDTEGVSYIGHETLDVEYFCNGFCLDLELAARDLPGEADSFVVPGTRHVSENGTIIVTTYDVDRGVAHEMPDYDVHCVHCGDLIHSVTPL